ncbi:alpha/beta hydrolase family protein [Thermomonas aquatica]|jgi:predicted alpha/beta hydrolase|uniref:Alpha/beta fold hydrolase n=1 Tax=Thermomonas aquatica TaxID=2202149 RepID=A0A5B7ZTL8_9GAMM|nr:alpha/beta fold hydrolase [Thermomonas aquatica]QDA58288.1 alpha/beta fold hydrolase [Thermomonas aquatica]
MPSSDIASFSCLELPVASPDGHRACLLARIPAAPQASLLWVPALGVAAKHYLPFADALAAHGVAVFLHEWRGNGSSNLRASRACDWGYRELLEDIAASATVVAATAPELPRIVGGHSLGGQLAGLHLALHPQAASALWLVASAAPYFRAYPAPSRWWLPLAYRFLPWLARVNGSLPGRWIRFAGNEARGVMADWARSALSGRYAASGLDVDLDAAMAQFHGEARAIALRDDWLAPPTATGFLLSKFRPARTELALFDAARLGTCADHFAWMKQPDAVADFLAG